MRFMALVYTILAVGISVPVNAGNKRHVESLFRQYWSTYLDYRKFKADGSNSAIMDTVLALWQQFQAVKEDKDFPKEFLHGSIRVEEGQSRKFELIFFQSLEPVKCEGEEKGIAPIYQLKRIADCHLKLKQKDQALGLLSKCAKEAFVAKVGRSVQLDDIVFNNLPFEINVPADPAKGSQAEVQQFMGFILAEVKE